MAGKVYTVQVNDEKLVSSKSSKQAKVVVKEAQSEVASYGIVEINNNSAKAKVKNTKEVGFEKNVVDCERKAVKSNLAKIDDYFDFSFRPEAGKKVAKKATAKSCKKEAKKAPIVVEVNTETTVVKAELIDDRQITVEAKACDRFIYDEEVKKVVSTAREGALFG